MQGVNNFVNGALGLIGSLWSIIFLWWIVRKIEKRLKANRSVVGAILDVLGTWVAGPILVATLVFWAVFIIALPNIEGQSRTASGQSRAGNYIFSCLNNDFECLKKANAGTNEGFTPQQLQHTESGDAELSATLGSENNTNPDAIQQITPDISAPQAPDPGLFATDNAVATCTIRWLLQKSAQMRGAVIPFPATSLLPAGSSWNLRSPNWGGHTFTGVDDEEWDLCSNDWTGVCLSDVNGELARALGGKASIFNFGGQDTVTVIGTGDLPKTCWPK